MTESEFLSPAELRDLTTKARLADQVRMLQSQGLPFREIGRKLLVSRHHMRAWLCGEPIAQTRAPNMGAIR